MAHILDCEQFGIGNRNYYIDLKRSRTKEYYLRITRSDQLSDMFFHRTQLVVFEEDLPFFVEALSMVLRRFSQQPPVRL